MEDYALIHTGIFGMKWGFRKAKKNTTSKKVPTKFAKTPTVKKSIKEMSDTEMRDTINRMQMEKQYKDLIKSEHQAEVSKGKIFVSGILEASGKNIATQLATYALGAAVNKVAGSEVVNPKKGQKDK